MPIYEYRCSKCGDFETLQKISDKPLTHCPTCRRKVSKLISSTTFQLKGSGWYITDYARKGEGGGAKGDKSEKKGEGSGGEATAGDASTGKESEGTPSKDASAGKSSEKKSSKKSEKAAAA